MPLPREKVWPQDPWIAHKLEQAVLPVIQAIYARCGITSKEALRDAIKVGDKSDEVQDDSSRAEAH